jgi:hypothetical protein
VIKYLDDTQRDVEYKSQVANEVSKVLNKIPTLELDLLRTKDRPLFQWMHMPTLQDSEIGIMPM